MATVMARYSTLKYRGFESCAVIQHHLGAPVLLFFFFFLMSISGTQRLRGPFEAFLGTRGTLSHECLL